MNRRVITLVLCVLGALLCGCSLRGRTEQQWLIGEITRNISSMLAFIPAPGRTNFVPPDVTVSSPMFHHAGSAVYHVRAWIDGGNTVRADVGAAPFMWSPDAFTSFTKQVISSWGIVLPPQGTDNNVDSLVAPLSKLTASSLQTANDQISKRLAANMLSPTAHEEAAFLLGCFALREASGHFYDTRQTLCRLCAHLTIARILRANADPSTEGQLAYVMLLTLVGRQHDALDEIARLRPLHRDIAGIESWLRALQMRNSGDWRLLQEATTASLIERMECYRARCTRVNTDNGVAFLQNSMSSEMIPDWSRILMQCNFTVEQGHQFVTPSVGLEFRELSETYLEFFDHPLPSSHLGSILNQRPAGCVHRDEDGNVTVHVIDWGTWAQFYQRHLCNAAMCTLWFLRDKWSVKEDAKAFQADADRQLKELDLYFVIIKRRNAEAKDPDIPEYEAAVRAGDRLIEESPGLLNCDNWGCLRDPLPGSNAAGSVSDPGHWFRPVLLPGTTYDALERFYRLGALQGISSETLDQLRSLAPYEGEITTVYCQRHYSKRMTATDVRKEYGEQCDYSLNLLTTIADRLQDNPQEYRATYETICSIDPNMYIRLGQYLVQKKMPEEAAIAFQKAVDLASSRLWVASSCRWLMDYYVDHGQEEKAVEIGRMAAEVYSYAGLENAAHLMERLGRLDDAEQYLKDINERYEDKSPLFGFYFRQNGLHSDGSYSHRLRPFQREIFPNGLEHVELSAFRDAPTDGCMFTTTSDSLTHWGLEKGDDVVALDGYRIRTRPQYEAAMRLKDTPQMALIVWHNGQYREFTVELEGRRFGVNIATYKP